MNVEIDGYDEETSEWAKEGDYRCAMTMLGRACEALKECSDPSLVYLRDCVERYLMNDSLKCAFYLHRAPRGRRPDRTKHTRDIEMALDVECLLETEDLSLERAIFRVADDRNSSDASVRKAYYRNRRKK